MSAEASIPIRITQTLGITSSLILSGLSLGFSTFTVPRLMESPTPLMLRQFQKMYKSGRNVAIPMAILSSLSYFYLAYRSHNSNPFTSSLSSSTTAYALAGLLTIGIVPNTIIVMAPTNKKLERMEKQVRSLKDGDEFAEQGEENAHVLIDRWATLNLGRVVMLVAASVVGIWTSISN